MQAEIIAVGTELLLGEIVNTNATMMAQQLATLGIDSHYQQVVGDNGERLDQALTVADQRADLIILIGGLGPTPDDLTKQVLAAHIGAPLVVNFAAIEKLVAYGKQAQVTLTPNNRVQAMLPFGATPLTNPVGLAVGAVAEFEQRRYVLLPGPPKEFTAMVQTQLVPYLQAIQGDGAVIASHTWRLFGITESQLATELADLLTTAANPSLASYVKDSEVTLRLSAKAATKEEATALMQPLLDELDQRVGRYHYADGEVSLAETVLQALAAKRWQLTAAESLTGGLLQAAITDIAGASNWFAGGFVTYSNHTKATSLGLDEAQVDQAGAVSEQTALAMAQGALEKGEADIAVALTGVAGPGPDQGIEAGTVWIAVATRTEAAAQLYHFPGSRAAVRNRAVKAALFQVLQAVKN